MVNKTLQVCALLCVVGLPLEACCRGRDSNHAASDKGACASSSTAQRREAPRQETRITRTSSASVDFPPNAAPGECYGKVYIPAKFETRTEKVMVREASSRVETVPARYEWVEERVMVKDASTELVEVPADYRTYEQTIEVKPARTEWVVNTSGNCRAENGQPVKDVYCLVTTPAETKKVTTQKLNKGACVREVPVAAEYQTVKRQKLVCPATTRRVNIPAEFESVEKSVCLGAGHVEWQRVMCDVNATPQTLNAVKSALIAAGYKPGPMDGHLGAEDWNAIHSYQQSHGLGVGDLSYQTLNSLQVSVK